MISITYRITGLIFLLITSTVLLLIYLANWQMTNHFQDYISRLQGGMMTTHMGMGSPEQEFLSSVHQSLGWVGALIVLVGLAASYVLARGITVPLRKLSAGVGEIERGNFSYQVEIKTNDEVEQLAAAFNRMSAALEANNRLRKQLLADIAHELRTPLAIIQGNLEGMLDGVVEADQEQLGSLVEETVHLNRLISDLRDLSLAEAGQLTLDLGPIDLNQLISRSVGLLKPLADEKAITFASELGTVPIVTADASRISQVLYNLITNAIRYSPEQGRVTVSSGLHIEEEQCVFIRISDNGQGIDVGDLPHIFDHFYRADKSRTRKSGGSGIGLAIVKKLVELHGGRIEVSSVTGVGSCFTVYLPVDGSLVH